MIHISQVNFILNKHNVKKCKKKVFHYFSGVTGGNSRHKSGSSGEMNMRGAFAVMLQAIVSQLIYAAKEKAPLKSRASL